MKYKEKQRLAPLRGQRGISHESNGGKRETRLKLLREQRGISVTSNGGSEK